MIMNLREYDQGLKISFIQLCVYYCWQHQAYDYKKCLKMIILIAFAFDQD